MTELLSTEELAVGRQVRALADAGAASRDPNAVVRAVLARPPRRGLMRLPLPLLATTGALMLVVVVALSSVSQVGSSPATAHVGGLTVAGINIGGTAYGVAVARSIEFSGARLTPVGEARQNSGFRTEGSTVYQVNEVDPLKILVMQLIPGEHDDAGSVGEYLVLVRGNGFSLLCPYFERGDPLAPSVCN